MVRIIILIALMLMPFVAFSERENQTKNEVPFLPLKSTSIGRPQTPTHQEITCVYTDGSLVFNIRYPEGMCELTVTEQNGNESSYSFDSASEAVIYVGELTTAHLLITTEYGHSYEGHLL